MRGADSQQAHLFSYVAPERRVPPDHPLRPIRAMVDAALEKLSPRFEALYAQTGRPSVPPEKLLRALLLQVFYSVRSERLFMEQLDYNLAVSLVRGDPEARLCRKGKGREAKLAYLGNLLMDNREGLAVAAQVSIATGDGETFVALELVEELEQRAAPITVGADKASDNEAFVEGLRFMGGPASTASRPARSDLPRIRRVFLLESLFELFFALSSTVASGMGPGHGRRAKSYLLRHFSVQGAISGVLREDLSTCH